MFLTFIACYELIQLIIEHNNLANFETWIFFKWMKEVMYQCLRTEEKMICSSLIL